MNKIIVLASFLITLILALFPYDQAMAQGADCGNGLAQQLSIGSTGWVIPEPPQSVNVRNFAGGDKVGQIEPSEKFTVLAGPECNSTYSWWQIESDRGVVGWIAEGVDGYFVEPLGVGNGDTEINPDGSLIATGEQCEKEPDSNFKIGDIVELTLPFVQNKWYYGHPLVENGFFSLSYVVQKSDSYTYVELYSASLLIMEGPVCFNGSYYWLLGETEASTLNIYDTSTSASDIQWALWIQGSANIFTKTANQVVVGESFVPNMVKLIEPPPIISAEQQIRYTGFGGPGPIPVWDPECKLADPYSVIHYSSHSLDSLYDCMSLYPFDVGAQVDVTVLQPDGSVYSKETIVAHTIPVSYRDATEIDWLERNVTGVNVSISNSIGLMPGVWTVVAISGDRKIARSYWLQPLEETFIDQICDGPYPQLALHNFPPEQSINLVAVSGGETSEEGGTAGGFNATILGTLREKYRWSFATGAFDELVAQPTFPVRSDYFVVADANGEWLSSFPEVIVNYGHGPFVTEAQWPCEVYKTPEDAHNNLIDNKALITGTLNPQFQEPIGELYYAFEGKTDDIINIDLIAFLIGGIDPIPEFDPILTLQGVDGTILVENDNADDPQYGAFDSSIIDFELPANGIYTIVVSYVESQDFISGGGYTLTLDKSNRIVDLATESESDLEYDQPIITNLDEKAQLNFVGIAGDIVNISVMTEAFDPIVILLSENGELLAEDDDNGVALNALIENYTITEDGQYTIRVASYSDKTGQYTVEITK